MFNRYRMSRKMAVVLMAVSMAFSISVFAGAHGTVSGSFTGPRWVDHDSIDMLTTVQSGGNQHDLIKDWLSLQRKVGSNWKLVETWRVDRTNSAGFTDLRVVFEPCGGTLTGTGTFRTTQFVEFFNDAGDRVHVISKKVSAAKTISNTECYDDGV